MTAHRPRTQTWEDPSDDKTLRHGARFVRFFRADDPFDAVEEFVLGEHPEWPLGRRDGGAADSQPHVYSCDDAIMSTRHAALRKTEGGHRIVDLGSKNGTFVNGKRTTEAALADGDIVECGHSFFMYREAAPARGLYAPGVDSALDTVPSGYQISAVVPYAASELSLLLYGETGTGKEVVARRIHELSGRRGAFVARNCAAIPDTLFESELFGFTKGAFSGASSTQRGQIALADGGTLFLDEIAELSPTMQAKLLRVLELKEVLPLGAATPVAVDFRLISATLRDLRQAVAAGAFRPDLYARLGESFRIPPLREHKEELGRLIQTFLGQQLARRARNNQSKPRVYFALAAARAVVAHAWPFNVRGLKLALESALIAALEEAQAGGETCPIELRHLPAEVCAPSPAIEVADAARDDGPPRSAPTARPLTDADFVAALKAANGNRAEAAKRLDVSERTVFRRLRRLRETGED